MKGLCPFHQEKTPSFNVSGERQTFHCFGCREGGDVFAFVMKRDGVEFAEALRALAARAGISMPEQNPALASRLEGLRTTHRQALAWFRDQLSGSAGRDARVYLEARGIDAETIGEFRFGFAPDGWEGLARHLRRARAPRKAVIESGLVRERERGEGTYDFFRNRLVLPIADESGPADRVRRAAPRRGRAQVREQSGQPDLPQAFGALRARPGSQQHAPRADAVLFEGYFDVVAAWRAGVRNGVAVCGTAFTEAHAKKLAASCREVVIAFDGDAAGRRAAAAAIPLLLAARRTVRVAAFPPGKDPDDVLREEGDAALRRILSEAVGFLDFAAGEAQGAAAGRAEGARNVLRLIAAAPDALDREAWISEIAGRLGFTPAALREELARLAASGRRPPPKTAGRGVAPTPAPKGVTPAERDLIRWAEIDPAAVAGCLRAAAGDEFEGLAGAAVLGAMKAAAEAGADSWDGLVGTCAREPGPAQRLVTEARMHPVPLNEAEQHPQDCLVALRVRRLRAELARIRREGAPPGRRKPRRAPAQPRNPARNRAGCGRRAAGARRETAGRAAITKSPGSVARLSGLAVSSFREHQS